MYKGWQSVPRGEIQAGLRRIGLLFRDSGELFTETQSLRLIVRPGLYSINEVRRLGVPHQVQPKKGLPVLNKKRHVPASHFQHHSRCIRVHRSLRRIAEPRVEEARVVSSHFTTARVE